MKAVKAKAADDAKADYDKKQRKASTKGKGKEKEEGSRFTVTTDEM
jgi:hypothetical protein